MNGNTNLLALDLGTLTGWAFGDLSGENARSGVWKLATPGELKRHKGDDDLRVVRLARKLAEFHDKVGCVAWEQVQFIKSRAQAHLWAGLRAVIFLWIAEQRTRPITVACPVGTLKKYATGNGSALKPEMAQCLAAKFPDRFVYAGGKLSKYDLLTRGAVSGMIDDNEVDALWLLDYAKHYLTEPK